MMRNQVDDTPLEQVYAEAEIKRQPAEIEQQPSQS
jgi:hypothetical protein